MDKVKIIIEEPTGSRRTFYYPTNNKKDTKEIIKMVKDSLKPGFTLVSHSVIEEK